MCAFERSEKGMKFNMHNKFKSIASVVLMLIMLFGLSVPVMATEQTSNAEEPTITTESVQNEISLLVVDPVTEFHYTGRLSTNKVLGTVYVGEKCKTLRWTVGRTGSSTGSVRFALTNRDTGDTRHISTTANNTLQGITYISAMTAGTWEISVEWNNNNWLYDLDLYFYKT